MKKETLDYVIEKTHELINSHTCSSETKASAQAWLSSVGSENEAEETKKYIEELEADIMPIDNLIAFSSSDDGIKYFGEETAKGIAEHAKEIKAAGAKYCDCPACNAVAAILDKKDSLLSC